MWMSATKTTAEVIEAVCNVGLAKSKLKLGPNLVLAFMAGAYIGLGSLLAIKVAGGMPLEQWGTLQRLVYGGVFPVGLLMVLLAGADLFTGDCMFMPSGLARGLFSFKKFLQILVVSYIGNFFGSIFVAYFGEITGMLNDPAVAKFAVNVANSKTNLTFIPAFVGGVFCNWLVCLAIFMALAVTDGVSKAVLIWPPIMGFVALGFEHSVANMTFIPLGIYIGKGQLYADLVAKGFPALTASWGGLVNNLIPVSLGNFVGGCLFVGIAYFYTAGLKRQAVS
jgi:formate/nitrite transporter